MLSQINGLKRFASTINSPNNKKLVNLLTRLDKFDNNKKIFDKLDELYLLSQRKGFFNLNSNNLEFLTNDSKIKTNLKNLSNFNDLSQLVSNQYYGLLQVAASPSAPSLKSTTRQKDTSSVANFSGSAVLTPMPRVSSSGINHNSNTPFSFTSNNNVVKSIPGLSAFSANNFRASPSKPIDKHLNLLHDLAKNDTELKHQIESILESFDEEDDFFFNYVLEFWISGKAFNKKKAEKIQDDTGLNLTLSNLTT